MRGRVRTKAGRAGRPGSALPHKEGPRSAKRGEPVHSGRGRAGTAASAYSTINQVLLIIESLQYKAKKITAASSNHKPERWRHCLTALQKNHIVSLKGQQKDSRSALCKKIFKSGIAIFSTKQRTQIHTPATHQQMTFGHIPLS